MSNQYNHDEVYDETSAANVEPAVYSEDDLLDSLDEEDTSGLVLQTLLPKGLYVIKIGRIAVDQMPGEKRVKGFKVVETTAVYDISNGKHMNRMINAYEWLIGKNGKENPDAEKVKGNIYTSIATTFPYAEEGFTGNKRDRTANRADALRLIRDKAEGYKPADLLRAGRDYLCIGYIKVEEANGDFDASNKLNIQTLEPITPTLLEIIRRHNSAGE